MEKDSGRSGLRIVAISSEMLESATSRIIVHRDLGLKIHLHTAELGNGSSLGNSMV